MVHPWAKYDENPPRGSWDFVLTRFSYGRTDGRTTRKHNASGALRGGGIKMSLEEFGMPTFSMWNHHPECWRGILPLNLGLKIIMEYLQFEETWCKLLLNCDFRPNMSENEILIYNNVVGNSRAFLLSSILQRNTVEPRYKEVRYNKTLL